MPPTHLLTSKGPRRRAAAPGADPLLCSDTRAPVCRAWLPWCEHSHCPGVSLMGALGTRTSPAPGPCLCVAASVTCAVAFFSVPVPGLSTEPDPQPSPLLPRFPVCEALGPAPGPGVPSLASVPGGDTLLMPVLRGPAVTPLGGPGVGSLRTEEQTAWHPPSARTRVVDCTRCRAAWTCHSPRCPCVLSERSEGAGHTVCAVHAGAE